jgi:hypothetical protein
MLRNASVQQLLRQFDRRAVAGVLPAVAALRMQDPHVLAVERKSIERLVAAKRRAKQPAGRPRRLEPWRR